VQLEIPLAAVAHAVKLGRDSNAVVILNPAPAQPLDEEILRHCTILTPNETETEILTGIRPTNENEARRAAGVLHSKGVETVIITQGGEGVTISSKTSQRSIPAYRVEAVDTTAAGDAFNGSLAFALADGRDLESAVRYACAVAAVSVTRVGAQPSLPTSEEVNEFINKNKAIS
jgi:ribokinase